MNGSRQILLARLAFKSILLNWRHSLATMLAILGGFSAVSLFDGFLLSIHEYNEEHYVNKGMVGHVLIEKAGAREHLFEDVWLYSLSREEQEKIAELLRFDNRIKASMRYLVVSGLISNGRTNALFLGAGYDEEQGIKIRGPIWAWNVIAGLPLGRSGQDGGLMLGIGLARRLGCVFDPTILQNPDGSYVRKTRPLDCSAKTFQLSVTTEHSQVNALNIPPLGVTDMQLREFNEKVLAMPLATAQQLFDTDRITRYVVLLNDPKLIPEFLRDFTARARAAGLNLEAVKWIDHPVAAVSKGALEVLSVFRGLFLAVVALIAAMSVANSMLKSINERIREIGTLRSFGFHRRDIVLLFSFEGLFLGLFSCMAGMLVTVILAFVIRNLGLTFKAGVLSTPMPLGFSMAFSAWVVTALLLSLITFGASWLVSRRASRMIIADALRHTA